jgi:branched-chain amino acid transport system ATP-binding protein
MLERSPAAACLAIEGLTKRFGGFYALNDFQVEVMAGDIHALIGPNGAGKTTLFNLITGVLSADSGRIDFEGQPLMDARPSKRTLKGIARTFQNIRLFPHLTVLETIMIGEHCRLFPSLWQSFRAAALQLPFEEAQQERAMRVTALALLEFFGLADQRDLKASDLPYGDQRRLEMARALATQPRLLLLDEPAAGMNPHETDELDELITRIRDRGVTIVLVEHDMRLVMEISDRVTVLNFGTKIAEGNPKGIQSNAAVIEAYLGEDVRL